MWTVRQNDRGVTNGVFPNNRDHTLQTSTLTKGFKAKCDKDYVKKLQKNKSGMNSALMKSKSSSNLKFQTMEVSTFGDPLVSFHTAKHKTKTSPQKLKSKNLCHTPFSTSNLRNSTDKLEKNFTLFDGSQLENSHTSRTHHNSPTLPMFVKSMSYEERFPNQAFHTLTIDRRFKHPNHLALTNKTKNFTETSNVLTMKRNRLRNNLSKEEFKSEPNLKHITPRPPRLPPRNNPFKQAFIRRLLLQRVHLRAFQLDFSNTLFKEGTVNSHAKSFPIVTSKNPKLSNIYVGDHLVKVGEKSLEGVTKDEFEELFKEDYVFKVTVATLKKPQKHKDSLLDTSSNHTSQSTTPTNMSTPFASPVKLVENCRQKRKSRQSYLHRSKSNESLSTNIYEEIGHDDEEEEDCTSEEKNETQKSLNEVHRFEDTKYNGEDSIEMRMRKMNIRETRHASIDNDDVFLTFFEEPNGNGIFIQKQRNKIENTSRRSSEDDNSFRNHTDSGNATLSSRETQKPSIEASNNLKRVVSTTSSGFVSEENISGSSIPSSNDKSPSLHNKHNPLEMERDFSKNDVTKEEEKLRIKRNLSKNESFQDDNGVRKAGVKLKRSNGFKSEKSFEEKLSKPPPLPPKTYKKQTESSNIESLTNQLTISNLSKTSNNIFFTISPNISTNNDFCIENDAKSIDLNANPSIPHLKNRLEINQFKTHNTFLSHKREFEDAHKNYENRFYSKNSNTSPCELRLHVNDDDDLISNNHEVESKSHHIDQLHNTSTPTNQQPLQNSQTSHHITHLNTPNPLSPFHNSSSFSSTTINDSSLLFEQGEFDIERYKKPKKPATSKDCLDKDIVEKVSQDEVSNRDIPENQHLPPPLPPKTLRRKRSVFKEKIPENNNLKKNIEWKEIKDEKNEENNDENVKKYEVKNDECYVETWSAEEVTEWMKRNCLSKYVGEFLSQGINGERLLELKRHDLVDLGMIEVGVRRDFERALMKLKK